MLNTLPTLTKRAIEFALKAEWTTAIELNTHILAQHPDNVDTKIRLGRCYIQTKQFDRAKKIFKELLKIDPLNMVVLRNLELAEKHKSEHKDTNGLNTKALLKEPGKCVQLEVDIEAKGITANDFVSGEELLPKFKKKSVELVKKRKNEKISIGSIYEEDIVRRVNNCIDKSGELTVTVLRGNNKQITVLIHATLPVFRADRQEIRPYLKKGSLDEDLENENEEVVEAPVEE